jgi:hypothetical protein
MAPQEFRGLGSGNVGTIEPVISATSAAVGVTLSEGRHVRFAPMTGTPEDSRESAGPSSARCLAHHTVLVQDNRGGGACHGGRGAQPCGAGWKTIGSETSSGAALRKISA